MNTVIRNCQESDLTFVACLYISNLKETYKGLLPDAFLAGLSLNYGLEKWGGIIRQENHSLLVAYENDQFLGFAACEPDGELEDCLYLSSLHVSKLSRGKGVGTKLINALAQYGQTAGYKSMSVCIVKGNQDAGKLYQRLGATYYKDFIDDFNGIECESQKFVWNELPLVR